MSVISNEDKQYLLNFAHKIKERRRELGMSQEELSRKCGYTDRSTMSRIEQGIVDVNQSKIVVIARALNTTPSYLLGWSENTNNGINNGIIGNNNNNNVIHAELDAIESELLSLCRKMTVTQKARLLTYATDLLGK